MSEKTVDLAGDMKFIGELQRVTYQDGDTFVLMAERTFHVEQYERVVQFFETKLPGAKVLLLDGGMRLGVVGKVQPDGAH